MNTEPSAIENLKSEHRMIESVLDALDSYAGSLAQGDQVPAEDLPLFVQFLRQFADAKHHAKEETILFVAMTDGGFPRNSGPIGCMLEEHVSGRALVATLSECAKQPSPWPADVVEKITTTVSEFSALLRAHIYKEDNMLYEMAKARLSPDLMSRVDSQCAKEDESNRAAGITAELESLANGLMTRHGCIKKAVFGAADAPR